MNSDSTGSITQVNHTDWEKFKAMADSDIVHDDDSPATTEADWAEAFACHSAAQLHAEVVRRKLEADKLPSQEQVAIGFDAEVLEYFRATGNGWQARMNDALKEWLKEHAA